MTRHRKHTQNRIQQYVLNAAKINPRLHKYIYLNLSFPFLKDKYYVKKGTLAVSDVNKYGFPLPNFKIKECDQLIDR